jgi:hypothetical protein
LRADPGILQKAPNAAQLTTFGFGARVWPVEGTAPIIEQESHH